MNKKKLVLVNDDEPAILNIFRKELERKGFEVITTLSSKEAFEEIKEKKPDLIVTDINLPDMKGTELVDLMVQENIFIPVIAISGEVKVNPKNYMFMEKPVSTRALGELISNHLNELHDLQLLKNISDITDINQKSLGKVMCFYPDKGWGLLRVLTMEKPLYINAADIYKKQKYTQLFPGQVVSFDIKDTQRGPRAVDVKIIFDEFNNLKKAA